MARDPRDWELQGSKDRTNWITLDARQGEVFSARHQTKTYWINNPGAYQAYRLFITKQAGAAENNMQVSEFSLLATSANGQWEEVCQKRDPFVYPVSLQAVANGVIVWVSVDCLWRLDLAANLLNCQETIAKNTHLHKASYSKNNGKYLLSCTQDGKPLLYEFEPERGLAAVPTGAGLHSASGGSTPRALPPGEHNVPSLSHQQRKFRLSPDVAPPNMLPMSDVTWF